MTAQLSLPLVSPRDRGRLNALRNIVAAVSDELRRQAPVVQGIVDFTVSDFPTLLRSSTPFELMSSNAMRSTTISPYPFQTADLVTTTSRPDTFSTIADLIGQLDLRGMGAPLDGVELIGIDESQVDTPLPNSPLSFLKSLAFRMYRTPDGSMDEAVGPIMSELRTQFTQDEAFESENKLLGYIRNSFVAYISALTALVSGRRPYVVLHGPLVRAIGGFSHLTFDYQTARDLLNLDVSEAGEFTLPATANASPVQGDAFTTQNLPLSPAQAVSGDANLTRFNEFCLQVCERRCASVDVFPKEAVPPAATRVTQGMVRKRDYPGFCLYFWMLRSLFDLARISQSTVSSVVESVSAATEMTRLVLPSLVALPSILDRVQQSPLRAALRATEIRLPANSTQRRELYRQVGQMIDRLRLSDSNLFSYVLAEAQYTSPVQIYRYRARNTFISVVGDGWLGIRNELDTILDALFPADPIGAGHPGYRVLMLYLRSTPLREPIRVEFFDLPHQPADQVAGSTYLLSLPYQEYGLPVVLYYADKMARTPTRLIQTVIEREYLDLVLQNRFSDPVSIMRVLGRLTRGYLQREGLS